MRRAKRRDLKQAEMLVASYLKTGKDMVTCVWFEQTRGVKLTGNVPVRVNHRPKRQGYPQCLPMVRMTNTRLSVVSFDTPLNMVGGNRISR